MSLLGKLLGLGALNPTEAVRRHRRIRRAGQNNTSVDRAQYAVFDLELTGQSLRQDSIISIGAIRMKGAGILPAKTFHSLVRPESALKATGVVVHGITPADLAGARALPEVLEDFLDFMGGAVLIGHQMRADMDFMDEAMERLYGIGLRNPAADIVALQEHLQNKSPEFLRHFGGMTPRADLGSMNRKYGIASEAANDAFGRAYVTAQIFQRFLRFLPEAGVVNVGELIAAGKP